MWSTTQVVASVVHNPVVRSKPYVLRQRAGTLVTERDFAQFEALG